MALTRWILALCGYARLEVCGVHPERVLFEAFSQEKGFESILSNMRGLFSQPFRVMGHEIRIDASIGVSLYPRDGIDAKSLLAAADRAMYAEKREKKAREET